MEELRKMQPEDETKQKMLDILKRFHAEEDMTCTDEDDDMLSEETIQKFLSGNQVSLDDLSAEDLKRFQRAVASGELSNMIEPWDPWWTKPSARTISLSNEGVQLVRPIPEQETVMSPQGSPEHHLSDIPAGPESPLRPLSKLSSMAPSPLLSAHLVDVIYSYCFTLRLYNGDWQSDALGATTVVLSMSSVLGEDSQPESVADALARCLEQTCSPLYRHAGGFRLGQGLLNDVVCLISLGGAALVCSLCDLQKLFQSGRRELKSEKPRNAKKDDIRGKLKCADRKLYYLMCWVHEQPGDAWSSLAAGVGMAKASVAPVDHGHSKPAKMEGRGECESKVLIEELQ
eukprot:TRINITY_DN1913_c0_g1_i1.p1 TRINITY_DN1913_c0_g1~~TRINITY_DN1913_c0_g1_i1.p1  ORF type:complete len:403 (+),score=44.35 TRINITY_DN1913_c0_g1_i1:178-1209(+)